MAVAVRISRAFTKKDKVAFSGYHGWSDWYLATNLSDKNNLNDHLLPGLSPLGVPKGLKSSAVPFKYNDTDDFERIIKNNPDDIVNSLIDFIEKMEKGFKLSKLSKIFWEKMSIENSKNPFNKDSQNKDRRKFEYFHNKNFINANIPDFYLKKYKKLFIEY